MCDGQKELFGIVTIVCPRCGKSFERLSPEWVYKIITSKGIKYYCSYSCWTKDNKKHKEEVRERKSFRLSLEEKELLFDMLDKGCSVRSITQKLHVTENCVLYYRKKRC